MTLKPKAMMKILKKHGFELVRVQGSHYEFSDGKGHYTAVPMHANSELPKGTERKILKEAGLNNEY